MFSGVRPFGVSLLICGYDYDEDRPFLYQCDPSVSVLVYPQLSSTDHLFAGFLFSLESHGDRSQLHQWENLFRKTVGERGSFSRSLQEHALI